MAKIQEHPTNELQEHPIYYSSLHCGSAAINVLARVLRADGDTYAYPDKDGNAHEDTDSYQDPDA